MDLNSASDWFNSTSLPLTNTTSQNGDLLKILPTMGPTSNETLSASQNTDTLKTAILAFNGFLSVIGLIGNCLVCLIIIGGRKMYTIANLFLMNLAIADMSVLLVNYPLWVIMQLLPYSWPFGSALCKIIPSVSDAFYGVSLGCMTVISLHRYRMIIYAMDTQLTFLQAKIIIVIIWLVSLCTISAPLYPAKIYYERNITKSTITQSACRTRWPSRRYERSYQLFCCLGWYAFPLIVIFFTFLRIRVYLRKQMRYEWLSRREHSELISNQIIGIKRALRMLAPVVVIFALLMLPWNLLRIVSVVMDIRKVPNVEIYIMISATMLVTNSILNPFIYYIMSQEFRQEFQKQFWLLRRCLRIGGNDDEFVIDTDTIGRRCIRRLDSIVGADINCNADQPEYQQFTEHRLAYDRRQSFPDRTSNGGATIHDNIDNTSPLNPADPLSSPTYKVDVLSSILEDARESSSNSNGLLIKSADEISSLSETNV